jgi:hypothetical protein
MKMGPSSNAFRKAEMNARQQWITGVMALLMLGTIVMMPQQMSGKSGGVARQSGSIVQGAEIRAELPADQVRDFTYN